MRIDLSRPIPGLLMALPLIAILLSVSRVPISATQPLSRAKEAAIETTGTAAIACAPDVGGQTARAMAARLDDGGGDRWNSLASFSPVARRHEPRDMLLPERSSLHRIL
jgi:hypothetical protein